MKIYALGPIGTNGHEAAFHALRELPEDPQSEVSVQRIELCYSHAEVFQHAVEESCYAVVPIENSTSGLVADTIHGFWLRQSSQPIISVLGEVRLLIRHSLVMRHTATFDTRMTVLSHPQALSQCRENLRRLGLDNLVPTRSTAEAGAMVAQDDRYEHSAAIVSPFAAQGYKQLMVVQSHMEDVPGNTTRFHLLGHNEWPAGFNYKTALIFWTKDKPRALVNALWAISAENSNMMSIHSLPLGTVDSYAFYVEFDEHAKTVKGSSIMRRLETVTDRILWLGSFPREQVVIGSG